MVVVILVTLVKLVFCVYPVVRWCTVNITDTTLHQGYTARGCFAVTGRFALSHARPRACLLFIRMSVHTYIAGVWGHMCYSSVYLVLLERVAALAPDAMSTS